VFLAAAASNSIVKMKKIVAAFRKRPPSSGMHRPKATWRMTQSDANCSQAVNSLIIR
jgi:hypothetical protein